MSAVVTSVVQYSVRYFIRLVHTHVKLNTTTHVTCHL